MTEEDMKSLYSNHRDQLKDALPPEERTRNLEDALVMVFKPHVAYRSIPVILFDAVSVELLARAFESKPVIIKSILASVNVAQRAIKRDLGIDIDTYTEQIDERKAWALAGYVKPLLPKEQPIPALMMLDHFWWVDKEMRAGKGRWEDGIRSQLNRHAPGIVFKKRKFSHPGGKFELDAAHPAEGQVQIGIDVKRYESPRDFHKRGDEITQKVIHLKQIHPNAKFYAVIYYPFPDKHNEVRQRYNGQGIDRIYFAGETSESQEQVALEILADAKLLG